MDFKKILLSSHIIFFALSVSVLFVYFVFKLEWPFSASIWFIKLLAWSTLIYPFTVLISLKFKNTFFFYLPLINLIISVIVVVIFYGTIFIIDPIKNAYILKSENLKKIESASRDFVCSDGSFFSIIKTKDPSYTEIDYFSSDFLKNPEKFYVPRIGYVKNSIFSLEIPKIGGQEYYLTEEGVKKNLTMCINKDGKAISEIYPEK